MTAPRCLRTSSSSRIASASRWRIAGTESGSASVGSIGAAGLSTASRAIFSASARANGGTPLRWKRRT